MIDGWMIFNKITFSFLPAAPLDACVLNQTLIGVGLTARKPCLYTLQIYKKKCFNCFFSCVFAQAGERLIIDVCTHCECLVEDGAVKKYKLSCKRFSCPPCPLVTTISFPNTDSQ